MFEKLVVSSTQRRKHTTAKFFLLTSMLYLGAVVVAFATSVLVSDPRLADASNVLTRIAPLPPGGEPKTIIDHVLPQRSAPSRGPDDRSTIPLGQLQTNRAELPSPFKFNNLTPDSTSGTQTGGPPGTVGNFGIVGGDRNIEAPPKPERLTPKPVAQPKPSDIKPMRLASTVLQGKAIERRIPVYPDLVKRVHLEGEVAVEVIISPEGRVESARAISGHPMLIPASLEAARGWRFGPTLLNGVPVRVTGVITFVFKMSE